MDDLKMQMRECRDMMKDVGGMFKKNKDRDQVVVLTFVLVLAIIGYMWWQQQQVKSPLDNRPRSFQSIRDDAGSHNHAGFLMAGVEMPLRAGIKTNSQGDYDYKMGASTMRVAGKTQSEWGGDLELMPKAGLDNKAKLTPKTTDAFLRTQALQ